MRGLSWPKQKSSIGNLFLVSPKESIWYLVYLEKCCHTPFPLSPWNEEKSGVLQKHLFWNSHDCHWHRHSEWTFEPQSCVSNWCLRPSTTCESGLYILYHLQIHQITLIPIPPAVWQKIFLKALSQNHPKSGSERPDTTLQSFKVWRHQVLSKSQHILEHTKWLSESCKCCILALCIAILFRKKIIRSQSGKFGSELRLVCAFPGRT